MNNEFELTARCLTWIAAPVAAAVALWIFVRYLFEALRSFMNAQGSGSGDTHFFRTEHLRSGGRSALQALIPLVAFALFAVITAAPWNPEISPVTYLGKLLQPEKTPPPAAPDSSLEFVVDAGVRFQQRIGELTAQLAEMRAERDRLAATVAALQKSTPKAEPTPKIRPANHTPTTTTNNGAPAISSSQPMNSTASTPAIPAQNRARLQELLQELNTRWPLCESELQAAAGRSDDGRKFASLVQPRLAQLRNGGGTNTGQLVRELRAAFDNERRIVRSAPTLRRVDQLLRQVEMLVEER